MTRLVWPRPCCSRRSRPGCRRARSPAATARPTPRDSCRRPCRRCWWCSRVAPPSPARARARRSRRVAAAVDRLPVAAAARACRRVSPGRDRSAGWSGSRSPCMLTLAAGLFPQLRRAVFPSRSSARGFAIVRALPRRLAFAIFAASAWQVAPSIPGGDEPHYLVITQSLLLDRDLKIENNHRRGDYQVYFAGALAPHYIQRGRDGEIYSIHAPGLSALVAPAFAIGGYRGVVLFLLVMAACGSALAWHLAWLATGQRVGGLVRLGGGDAVGDRDLSQLHRLSRWSRRRRRADRHLGALSGADEERGSGSTPARAVVPARRGAGDPAVDAQPLRHARGQPRRARPAAPAADEEARWRRRWRFCWCRRSARSRWIAFFVVVYGRADPSAPYGTSPRDFSLAFIPGGLDRAALRSAVRAPRQRSRVAVGFAGLGWLMLRSAPREPAMRGGYRRSASGARAALRARAVSADRHQLCDVVGRVERTGTLCQSGGLRARHSRRRCSGSRATTRGHRATVAIAAGSLALHGVPLVRARDHRTAGRLAYNTREATALWLDWASPLTALGSRAAGLVPRRGAGLRA